MAIGSNGEYWPEDLVTEILSRLPIKSIIRFKCVSTTWYHLFKTPTFVSQHLSLNKNNTRVLVHYREYPKYINDRPYPYNFKFDMFDFGHDCKTLVRYHGLHPQLPPHIAHLSHVYVHNSLVCLLDKTKDEITIWNPATNEFRILPQPQPRCSNLNQQIGCKYTFLGFGLDPMSNDYKVVCIQELCFVRPKSICCSVYKMSADSWRVVNEKDAHILRDMSSICYNACANGVCCWRVTTSLHGGRGQLLGFHLGNETFQLMQLPPGEGYNWEDMMLSSYNDRICLWCKEIPIGENDSRYGIWVLDDEEGHNWFKLFTVEHSQLRVARVWREGEVLTNSVDVVRVLLGDIQIRCGDVNTEHLWVYPFQESLVGIGISREPEPEPLKTSLIPNLLRLVYKCLTSLF